MELVLGAGERDVEEPGLLGPALVAGGRVVGDESGLDAGHHDQGPLQALGGMEREHVDGVGSVGDVGASGGQPRPEGPERGRGAGAQQLAPERAQLAEPGGFGFARRGLGGADRQPVLELLDDVAERLRAVALAQRRLHTG